MLTNLPSTRASSDSLPLAEAIDPEIVSMVGAALVADALELRSGKAVERPAFEALLAGRSVRPGKRLLAFGSIETGEMSAGENRPSHAVEVDIHAAGAEGALRRLENLGDRRVGGIAARNHADEIARLRDAGEARAHRLAPDHVALRARHDAVERRLDPFVLGRIGRLIR